MKSSTLTKKELDRIKKELQKSALPVLRQKGVPVFLFVQPTKKQLKKIKKIFGLEK